MAGVGMPDVERRTGSIDHLIGNSRQLTNLHNSFNLSEPANQPEIATGHTKNSPNSLRISEVIHVERQPKFLPPSFKDENYFILPKRFVLVSKSNTDVKLRILHRQKPDVNLILSAIILP